MLSSQGDTDSIFQFQPLVEKIEILYSIGIGRGEGGPTEYRQLSKRNYFPNF